MLQWPLQVLDRIESEESNTAPFLLDTYGSLHLEHEAEQQLVKPVVTPSSHVQNRAGKPPSSVIAPEALVSVS